MNPGRPSNIFIFLINLICKGIHLTPDDIVSFISQLLTHPAKSFGLSQRIWSLSPVTCHLAPVTFQVSLVSHRMSHVACHLSPVTCHLSVMPTATSTDPPPASSPIIYNMLVAKLKSRLFCKIEKLNKI